MKRFVVEIGTTPFDSDITAERVRKTLTQCLGRAVNVEEIQPIVPDEDTELPVWSTRRKVPVA